MQHKCVIYSTVQVGNFIHQLNKDLDLEPDPRLDAIGLIEGCFQTSNEHLTLKMFEYIKAGHSGMVEPAPLYVEHHQDHNDTVHGWRP